MDGSDSYLDKEYEKLNEAIKRAIITSDEIKDIIQDYQSKNMIKHMTVINMVVRLEELSEEILRNSKNYDLEYIDENETNQTALNKAREIDSKYLVDGEELSQNEVLFERFCQGKFDEEEWLKNLRVCKFNS